MVRTVSRDFYFCAAHRLLGHAGKCKFVHGHNYVATVVLRGKGLDEQGMLVDFGLMKEAIGGWIDANWDHNIILNSDDPIFRYLPTREDVLGRMPYTFHAKNPTAENMAEGLYREVSAIIKGDGRFHGLVRLHKVTIHETENCSASFKVEPLDMRNL